MMLYVKAGEDRRAFMTPHGPEIMGEYRGVRDTAFIRRQLETGDLVEKADAVRAADSPAKPSTPPAPDAPRAPDDLKKG